MNRLLVPVLVRSVARQDATEGRVWRRVVARVLARPGLSLAAAAVVLLAMAAPAARPQLSRS